jgi:hypothetical protein
MRRAGVSFGCDSRFTYTNYLNRGERLEYTGEISILDQDTIKGRSRPSVIRALHKFPQSPIFSVETDKLHDFNWE